MDTSTGLLAVIVDNGRVSAANLRAAVAYTRSASEIVRAVVATARPDAVRADVAPAFAVGAAPGELADGPSFPLLSRVAAWSEAIDGEKVRMMLWLDAEHVLQDPWIVYECLQRIITNALADGIVGVKRSSPEAGVWRKEEEWIRTVKEGGFFSEDPSLYLFRRAFIEHLPREWRGDGNFLPYEIVPIHG